MKKLFLLTNILLLAACQQSTVNSSDNVEPMQDKSDYVADVHEQEIKQSVSDSAIKTDVPLISATKSTGSGLKFTHSTSSERAKVGVPYEIDINFELPANSKLTADFSTTPGLSMNSPKRSVIEMGKSENSAKHRVSVIPQSEGIFYLTFNRVGAEQEKPSAIKIIVGDKDIEEYMQTVGEVIEQEDGTKVISMKADEGN